MDKVFVYERITFNWTCPKCQTNHEWSEDESTVIGDTLECDGCGEEFEYDMSD